MENYCISVDWLQCYCLKKKNSSFCNNPEIRHDEFHFQVVQQPTETAMFKQLHSVSINGLEVATLESSPRSSKLKQDMVLVKLTNRVLYSHQYVKLLYALFDAFGLIYKGITRIDLCYDCVKFSGGRSPQRFIQNFVFSNSTTKTQYSKVGRDEFICHGKKSTSTGTRINYIAFGSGKSRYRSYIYDKTLELEEVHDKPWIRKTWEENGIISSPKAHVYRSEISIKSSGTDLLNMSSGELFKLSPLYLENQRAIEKLFHYYANRVLHFKQCTGQKRKKDYKEIQLFENKPEITCKPISISKSHDTGRIEKICYNVLDRLSKTYVDLSAYRSAGLKDAMDFLSELCGIKSGILAQERYKRYLDNFECHMFSNQHVLDYLQAIENTHSSLNQLTDTDAIYFQMCEELSQKQPEISPDVMYQLFNSFTSERDYSRLF